MSVEGEFDLLLTVIYWRIPCQQMCARARACVECVEQDAVFWVCPDERKVCAWGAKYKVFTPSL